MLPGPRLSCCITHCHRTKAKSRAPHATEWICSDHWRLVSRNQKWRLRKIKRILKRLCQQWDAAQAKDDMLAITNINGRWITADELRWKIWEKCKEEAHSL